MKLELRLFLPMLAVAAISVVGCMIGETRHTLYLEPDGSMTWIVEEARMRSAEDDPTDRRHEEDEWMGERAAETHGPAEALWEIGATSVETVVVRDRRPFHVVTRATFESPEDAFRRLFEAAGLIGEIEVASGPAGGAIAIWIDVEATEANAEEDHEDRAIDSLLGGDEFLVMVADGRFDDSLGFEVEDDIARFDEDGIERALERDPRFLRLYLQWTRRE